MTLGQKIRAARQARGMTQKEVVGEYITRNMLSKIENDSATPSVRTLEYLAGALDLPTGYFLDGAGVSDGSSPDGLDEARQAFRAGNWQACLTLLEADKKAGTTDEGCLLHALAGTHAARQALRDGRLEEARELAETAQYYNQEGLYRSREVAAGLAILLGQVLKRLGEDSVRAQREALLRALAELEPEQNGEKTPERNLFQGNP